MDDINQREMNSMFKGVGHFGDYCRNIYKKGMMAEQTLAQHEELAGDIRKAQAENLSDDEAE